MYKSSWLTYLHKYSVIFTFPFLAFLISDLLSRESQLGPFGALIMVGWFQFWMIMMMIRIKRVEATPEHFVVKNLTGTEIISYKDIEYVSEMTMINPRMISIKYNDVNAGESKKILVVLPIVFQLFNFYQEHEMTKFIRRQLIKARPDYNKDSEPPRWLPGLIIMGSMILMMMILFAVELP